MTTPRYPWLLFDADDTLFDYGRAETDALVSAFAAQGVAFQGAWLPVYQRVNAAAWRMLEEGAVTAARLRVLRFEQLFSELRLALDPASFSAVYLRQLSQQAHLVAGARDVLQSLHATHRFAIITNGLSDVQRPRLASSPLAPLIDHVLISEELGVAKPAPGFFDIAIERLGSPDRRDLLIIGDSLSSDIAGGVASSIDTCWFNPGGLPRRADVVPKYEIRSLAELPAIVG